jgi:hypothetical protein
MATKTPALSTQLKTAKAEIVVLQEKIVKLGTEVKQQSEYKDRITQISSKATIPQNSLLNSFNKSKTFIRILRGSLSKSKSPLKCAFL